ncbi:Hypothetical Protein PANA_2320 [Pantoea ananatis LMG 20103]|uniref:Uncharacterized protein n=1 Tax=Pantoea ananatis (strain LMG 20103) TaxID=706191 RepID=D4GH40_PANAM|nr:Hypothetical Protein PANA_2320 [Pantoea ananatis LMG 20103]
MAVPEAAMYKDNRLMRGHDKVRTAWQVFVLYPIAESTIFEQQGDSLLYGSVLLTNCAHIFTARFAGVNVGHSTSLIATYSTLVVTLKSESRPDKSRENIFTARPRRLDLTRAIVPF